MANLKKSLEELGFTDVKTLLNSGNAVFNSEEKNIGLLTQEIQQKLEKTFGFFIRVMVRTAAEIQALVTSDPFNQITITPDTRLYVTFLAEEPMNKLTIPYESQEKDFGILQVSKKEICSYLHISPNRGTVDLMSFVEKEFSKNVTTRNWNTIVKLAKK